MSKIIISYRSTENLIIVQEVSTHKEDKKRCLASELILHCTTNQIKPLSFQTSRSCSILASQLQQQHLDSAISSTAAVQP